MGKEYYRKQIIDLRARVAREREAKKRYNARYAQLVRQSTSLSSKTSYRRSKISASAAHDRNIESLKRQIVSAQRSLKLCR